jgi:four helix bundle protein
MKKFDIEDRLISFGVSIIKRSNMLPRNRIGNYLSHQIVRSSLTPALNYGEAQGAESKKDFMHKLRIILKELRETSISLKIINKTNIARDKELLIQIQNECNELIAIFTQSLTTAQLRK